MQISQITAHCKDVKKICVDNPDNAIEIMIDGILNQQILYFDNKLPVIKLDRYYVRIDTDTAEAVIFNSLDYKSQISVPSQQIREVLKRIRFLPTMQIDLTECFWKQQQYINLLNGVYDINRQKLVSVTEDFKFDYCIGINYIPYSSLDNAPTFKQYVESSIGMEQYPCLMRMLGYCISSLTKGRKAFCLYGEGKTGKSTILNVIEAVMNNDLVSHEPFHNMSGERSKAHYEGKRINISRETSTKVNRNEESFKSLISCEYTTGSEKFEKQRDFVATLKFIFAGNTDLEFAHMDDAILDRLVYIMYTNKISEEEIDLDLEEKLLEEKDVIFSLAVDSLKELIESKYDFKMSSAAESYIQHKRNMIHSAEGFLTEKCKLSDTGKVSKVSLYNAYNCFCKLNALKPDGRNTFLNKVRNFSASITDGRVTDKNGHSVQGFHGISLTSEEYQKNDAETDE